MAHINTKWHSLKTFDNLATDEEHTITIHREAIPIIVVPGIMGTALRNKQTGRVVWNVRKNRSMIWNYRTKSPKDRRRALIGPSGHGFNSNFLEVDNSNPIGDGSHAIIDRDMVNILSDTYSKMFKELKNNDWGALNKVFEFPVYAFGYNWTDSNFNTGKLLNERIDDIIQESKKNTGLCEKVIIITHSMGGLVARSASELHGARDKILGIIHGVQPATGAPLVYSKLKIGNPPEVGISKEVQGSVLGRTAKHNIPIIGNTPGGLELLPNKLYTDNNGNKQWLHFYDENNVRQWSRPNVEITNNPPDPDPYEDIYRVPGTAHESDKHPERKVWGLIDPDLLDPEYTSTKTITPAMRDFMKRYKENLTISSDDLNRYELETKVAPWEQYKEVLKVAEDFHEKLGNKTHPKTYTFTGSGHDTYDCIKLFRSHQSKLIEGLSDDIQDFPTRIEDYTIRHDEPYTHGHFWGVEKYAKSYYFIELRKPSGKGDGTVPKSSAIALNKNKFTLKDKSTNKMHEFDCVKYTFNSKEIEHQSAYKDATAIKFSINAIYHICEGYINKKRNKGRIEVGELILTPKGFYFDYENGKLEKIPEGSYYDSEDNIIKKNPEGFYFDHDEDELKKIKKNDDLIL